MIYLDNAATSRYKPKSVFEALNYDLTHSANSGRSGHKDALSAGVRIEKCRLFLLDMLGAADGYQIVFTKNCTEALNLAILGSIEDGDTIVTTSNEHNSVLRPLEYLRAIGKINLIYAPLTDNGQVDISKLRDILQTADLMVVGGASNVTGEIANIEDIAKLCQLNNVRILVDGAQSVPIIPLNMSDCNIDMLACPAHKGLHGIQGVGFAVFKNDITLKPLLYGGTGTYSASLVQPVQPPEGLESGTQFSGGISALHAGAEWTVQNINKIRNNTFRLSKKLIEGLKDCKCTLYSSNPTSGVVSFNIANVDSTLVAQNLDEYGFAVRSGLHCAPLIHMRLGTLEQGAVRASIGCDTTDKDINAFILAVDKISRTIRL